MATSESIESRFRQSEIRPPYHASHNAPLPLGYIHKQVRLAESVYVQSIIMCDDSMSPVFRKGDVLTIDCEDDDPRPGVYMLIRMGMLLLVRRFIVRGEKICYWPEDPCEHEIVDEGMIDPWGTVTAVKRADGTSETLDLDKLAFKEDEWPLPAAS